MLKLLLADADSDLLQVLVKQLKDKFEIFKSTNGVQTLEMVLHLKPDFVLLDLHLPQMDGMEILRTLRTSGNPVPVLTTGYLENDWICAELNRLQVSAIFLKPCNVSALASRILDVAEELASGKTPGRTPENFAHHLLLSLGFRMGFARYECVYHALLLKYQGECGGITKCLYPKVAKQCGGNTPQVEKAVRDAIKDAFGQGNPAVWKMYFSQQPLRCPSNDVFLARMAFAMQEYFEVTTQGNLKKSEKYA